VGADAKAAPAFLRLSSKVEVGDDVNGADRGHIGRRDALSMVIVCAGEPAAHALDSVRSRYPDFGHISFRLRNRRVQPLPNLIESRGRAAPSQLIDILE
jgi:hypothetical protein